MRRVLPLVVAGTLGFALARWWPIAQPVKVTSTPPPTPAVTVAAPPVAPAPARAKMEGRKARVRDRFTSNFIRKDPFGSAKRLLAEIDAMTAEDFRKLEQEGDWPSPSTWGFDKEFSRAFGDALVERWLSVDPDGSIAAMFRLNKAMDHGDWRFAGANEMLEALARVRPELYLTESLKGGSTKALDGNTEAAFRSLATKDIAAARRIRDNLPRPEQRRSAEIAIAMGMAQSDPVAAVALARELNSGQVFAESLNAAVRIGPGILGQVLEANDGKFPDDGVCVSRPMYRYPDLPWDRLGKE